MRTWESLRELDGLGNVFGGRALGGAGSWWER
jgi:hypothetical protein